MVGASGNTTGAAGNTNGTSTPGSNGGSSSFDQSKLLQIGVPIFVGLSAMVTLAYTLYKWYHKKQQQQPAVGIPLAGSSGAMYGAKGLPAAGPIKSLQVVTVDGQDSLATLAPLHPAQVSMLAPSQGTSAGLQQQYYSNALQQAQAQPQLYSPHAASRI
jgi:hypothetical protein